MTGKPTGGAMCGRCRWAAASAKLFRLGQCLPLEDHAVAKLPINTQLAAYGNVVKPEFGPDRQLRFQIQFLFPKEDYRQVSGVE